MEALLNKGTYVSPEGSLSSPIAIIGEAGGSEEGRLHRPFVGATGREVFNPCLSSAGIIRCNCYISNVIKEHPKNNDLSVFLKLDSKYPYESAEYKQYLQVLKEELSFFTGNIIVAMGNVALYALTGYKDVTKRRGSIYPCTLVEGKKVLACIHPAAALRQYSWRHLVTRDLKIAKDESKFSEIRTIERNIRTKPSVVDFRLYLSDIRKQGFCYFDIENTMSDQVTHLGFSLSATDAMSFPLVWERRNYLNPEQELEILLDVGDLLEDYKVTKIGQNLTHDSTIMWARYGIVTRNIEDTMIAATIINPDLSKGADLPGRRGKKKRGFPVGLAFLTSWYTCENYYKDEGKRWKDGSFDDEEHSRYNGKDCCVTAEIWPKQKSELERMGNWNTYQRQRDSFYSLLYASCRGRRIDSSLIVSLKEDAEKRLINHLIELKTVTGKDLNPVSSKQLVQHFYLDKGIKPYTNRKTHKPTVDEIALARLATRGFKEASIILDIRELEKLIGTYYNVRVGIDGRMRTSYNPAGTETGRSSSSAFLGSDEGTNMQNQPPPMKRVFVADEECILVEVDKSQAENRIVAYTSDDPSMIKAFEENIDLHKLTASGIYNKPWQEISEEKGSSKFSGGTYSERDDGKRANHSFNYGFGAESFALKYRVPLKNAKAIRDGYLRLYKNVPAVYWKYVEDQLKSKRSITNCLGRTRIFLDRMGYDLFKVGYAFIPQSTVADIIHLGKQWLWNNSQQGEYYGELLGETHDSLTLQYKISDLFNGKMAEELLQLKQIIEPLLTWKHRSWVIPTDIKIGFSLGAWRKDFSRGMKGVSWGGSKMEFTENLTKVLNFLQNGV